jgi:hypothetical protein
MMSLSVKREFIIICTANNLHNLVLTLNLAKAKPEDYLVKSSWKFI